MENKQIAAVAVVAILIVAAVGVYFVMSGGDSEYRSTNTDCRLQILGTLTRTTISTATTSRRSKR